MSTIDDKLESLEHSLLDRLGEQAELSCINYVLATLKEIIEIRTSNKDSEKG